MDPFPLTDLPFFLGKRESMDRIVPGLLSGFTAYDPKATSCPILEVT